MELPDEGDYGFALPPEQILPTCRETMDGMVELFKPRTPKFFRLSGEDYIDSGAGENNVLSVSAVVFFVLIFFIIHLE